MWVSREHSESQSEHGIRLLPNVCPAADLAADEE
jgi:hypothetical protein